MDNAKIKNDIINFLQQDCGVSKKQLEDAKTIFSTGLLDSLDDLRQFSRLQDFQKLRQLMRTPGYLHHCSASH